MDGWENNKGHAYLVPQPFARDNSNFIADTLVNLEVEREFWVVSLDDDLSGLLDGFRTNATHDCDCRKSVWGTGWGGDRWLFVAEVGLRKCENVEIALRIVGGICRIRYGQFGWQAQHVTLQPCRGHYAHVRAYCSLSPNEFSTEGLRVYGRRFGTS